MVNSRRHIDTSPHHHFALSHIATSPHHHFALSHFTTSPLHHFTTSPHRHIATSPLHHFTLFAMNKDELQERILQFILRIIKLSQKLPRTTESFIIKKQLLRSATSVGANHRAMRRARSGNEYFAKLSIVVEEADETLFWLELLVASEIVTQTKLALLMQEAKEILSIFASTRKKYRFKEED